MCICFVFEISFDGYLYLMKWGTFLREEAKDKLKGIKGQPIKFNMLKL
jgi:hypothetical protein